MKRYIKSFILILIALLMIIPNLTYASTKQNQRYFVGPLINPNDKSIEIQYALENGNDYKQGKWLGFGNTQGVMYKVGSTDENNIIALSPAEGGANVLNFPGSEVDTTGLFDGRGLPVTKEDEEQVSYVTNTMKININKAIAFVYKTSNPDSTNKTFLNVILGLAKKNYPGYTFRGATDEDLKKVNVNLEEIANENGPAKGTKVSDFIVMRHDASGKEIVLQYSTPKGYLEGQWLHEDLVTLRSQGKADNVTTGINDRTDWSQMIFSAYNAYRQHGFYYPAYAGELNPPSTEEKIISKIFSGIVNGIISLLGLKTMPELFFNAKSGVESYLGLMDASWMSVAQVLLWFTQVLAFILIIMGALKIAQDLLKSTVSSSSRVDAKEKALEYLYVILMLAFYRPLFYLIALLNYTIVTSLSGMVTSLNVFNFASGGVGGLLASLILAFGVLWIMWKINLEYIMRSLLIVFLYITGPLAIVSILFNGKEGLFSKWLKELIVNIFLQSFHALTFVLMASLVMFGQSTTITKVIFMYSFIPLSKFIKDFFSGSTLSANASKELGNNANTGLMGLMSMGTSMLNNSYQASHSSPSKPVNTSESGSGSINNNSGIKPTVDTPIKLNTGNTGSGSGSGSENVKKSLLERANEYVMSSKDAVNNKNASKGQPTSDASYHDVDLAQSITGNVANAFDKAKDIGGKVKTTTGKITSAVSNNQVLRTSGKVASTIMKAGTIMGSSMAGYNTPDVWDYFSNSKISHKKSVPVTPINNNVDTSNVETSHVDANNELPNNINQGGAFIPTPDINVEANTVTGVREEIDTPNVIHQPRVKTKNSNSRMNVATPSKSFNQDTSQLNSTKNENIKDTPSNIKIKSVNDNTEDKG